MILAWATEQPLISLTASDSVLQSVFRTATRGVLLTLKTRSWSPLLRVLWSHPEWNPESCWWPTSPDASCQKTTSPLFGLNCEPVFDCTASVTWTTSAPATHANTTQSTPAQAVLSALRSPPPEGCRLKNSPAGHLPSHLSRRALPTLPHHLFYTAHPPSLLHFSSKHIPFNTSQISQMDLKIHKGRNLTTIVTPASTVSTLAHGRCSRKVC